ncbi:MAG: XdhC family protein [Bacteroidota bacterium]
MTHEFKRIVQAHTRAKGENIRTVLATVVALKGSSYRRPGVSMLIREDEQMVGAVSGGCVEKEVLRQSHTVFETNCPKMMVYDGRYRLGCEGILYILIEPFLPGDAFHTVFEDSLAKRIPFELMSRFELKEGSHSDYGTSLRQGSRELALYQGATWNKDTKVKIFTRSLDPCFKLWIVGAEHDAVQLCTYAALTGWEVCIWAAPSEEKSVTDFSGAQELWSLEPEELPLGQIDGQTAVVVMTHSYVRDLRYLLALKHSAPAYLGLLGPQKRREQLLAELMERDLDIPERFLEGIHGPTGLDIGAETPQEIAIAILAEILSVIRNRKSLKLKDKQGAVHS